jgi:hypothetical protein
VITIERPRLLPAPAALVSPEVADETDWAGVEITGDIGGEQAVDSIDLSASRLAGVRLTGRRLDAVRVVDVLFEGCELTGADFSTASTSAVALHGSTLQDLKGAASLRGAVIACDQVLALAPRVFASLGIVVDDEYLTSDL